MAMKQYKRTKERLRSYHILKAQNYFYTHLKRVRLFPNPEPT